MLSKNIKAKLYLIDDTMFRIRSDRRTTLYRWDISLEASEERRWLTR